MRKLGLSKVKCLTCLVSGGEPREAFNTAKPYSGAQGPGYTASSSFYFPLEEASLGQDGSSCSQELSKATVSSPVIKEPGWL